MNTKVKERKDPAECLSSTLVIEIAEFMTIKIAVRALYKEEHERLLAVCKEFDLRFPKPE